MLLSCGVVSALSGGRVGRWGPPLGHAVYCDAVAVRCPPSPRELLANLLKPGFYAMANQHVDKVKARQESSSAAQVGPLGLAALS